MSKDDDSKAEVEVYTPRQWYWMKIKEQYEYRLALARGEVKGPGWQHSRLGKLLRRLRLYR